MKIKNKFLASLLTKIGHEVKAELVIDDTSGTTLTFPDISEISEIVEGVAVDAEDGTYTIADGDGALIVVVLSGIVDSVTTEMAVEASNDEINVEVAAVLEAISDEIVAVKSANAKLVAELKDLKRSLKHDTAENNVSQGAEKNKIQFKAV